ncbi:HAD family hydrolase [Winogradskyella bathintestinalis]|uniref:HAD family hydrolase n=1 Tax=Winogradskyella bathintestinalis TaxID=3035208 RepID=A0ABT7ZXL1_9FLAO|nr:HAD family hydrolase [Winogradskyella bathintestinalis]MDN3493735.1 HAD family hydrolase [Winogradskyella bathintestinalis]
MDIKVSSKTVIVFDLDDTLYNELDYLKSAYKAIAISVEPTDWRPLYSKMFSLYRNKINAFDYIADLYNTKIELLVEMYRNHQPNIQLFDGVLTIFEAIRAKNGKIGMITDGRSRTQRAKLQSLNILNFIDKIIISEELGTEKPQTANFEAMQNALPASEYCYIADNLKKDFIAPNILGWNSVGLIDNGKNIHSISHQYMNDENRPQHFIIDFNDITII